MSIPHKNANSEDMEVDVISLDSPDNSSHVKIKNEKVSSPLIQSSNNIEVTVKSESDGLNNSNLPTLSQEIPFYDNENIRKASDITSIKHALSFTPLIRETLNLIQSSSDLNSIVKNTTTIAEKFKEALSLIEQLPGIDVSIEKQQILLEEATQRYQRQRERHLNYLQLPIFQQIHKRPRDLSSSPEEPLQKKLKE